MSLLPSIIAPDQVTPRMLSVSERMQRVGRTPLTSHSTIATPKTKLLVTTQTDSLHILSDKQSILNDCTVTNCTNAVRIINSDGGTATGPSVYVNGLVATDCKRLFGSITSTSPSTVELKRCNFTAPKAGTHRVAIPNGSLLVEDCYIEDNGSGDYGLEIGASVTNFRVYNTVLTHFDKAGLTCAMVIDSAVDLKNCTFDDNQVNVLVSVTGNKCRNTIFMNQLNATYGSWFSTGGDRYLNATDTGYNIFYNNAKDFYRAGDVLKATDLTGNPDLTTDYWPENTSAGAYETGYYSWATTEDILGYARNDPPDIGAHDIPEYTGVGQLVFGGAGTTSYTEGGDEHIYTGSGTLYFGGAGTTSKTDVYAYTGSGQLLFQGAGTTLETNAYAYTGGGQLLFGGAGTAIRTGNYSYTGSGQLLFQGSGTTLETNVYAYTGAGQLVFGGAANASYTEVGAHSYTGSGSLYFGGAATTLETRVICIYRERYAIFRGRGNVHAYGSGLDLLHGLGRDRARRGRRNRPRGKLRIYWDIRYRVRRFRGYRNRDETVYHHGDGAAPFPGGRPDDTREWRGRDMYAGDVDTQAWIRGKRKQAGIFEHGQNSRHDRSIIWHN